MTLLTLIITKKLKVNFLTTNNRKSMTAIIAIALVAALFFGLLHYGKKDTDTSMINKYPGCEQEIELDEHERMMS